MVFYMASNVTQGQNGGSYSPRGAAVGDGASGSLTGGDGSGGFSGSESGGGASGSAQASANSSSAGAKGIAVGMPQMEKEVGLPDYQARLEAVTRVIFSAVAKMGNVSKEAIANLAYSSAAKVEKGEAPEAAVMAEIPKVVGPRDVAMQAAMAQVAAMRGDGQIFGYGGKDVGLGPVSSNVSLGVQSSGAFRAMS